MSWYEDDRPRETPEELKGLTHEQLRERIDKLWEEFEQKKREGKIRFVNA
ncbi:MAG: hypothetical protein LBM59_00635 [Ruminococcus sp.]|jgi:hypothetical protein|nr:hypothetical protein [Ruminococcus sp.]